MAVFFISCHYAIFVAPSLKRRCCVITLILFTVSTLFPNVRNFVDGEKFFALIPFHKSHLSLNNYDVITRLATVIQL